MIEHHPIRAAGTAMLWQAFQMGGEKALYMVRLLVLAILFQRGNCQIYTPVSSWFWLGVIVREVIIILSP